MTGEGDVSYSYRLLADERIKQSIGVLKVWPENFWRDVWHDAPCRGIMKHHNQFRHGSEDNVLQLFECMTCGTRFYAGLRKDRRIVVEAEGVKEVGKGTTK